MQWVARLRTTIESGPRTGVLSRQSFAVYSRAAPPVA